MKTHLDLRCSRRLTVREGRAILQALDAAGMKAEPLRAKLADAIKLAMHECDRRGHGQRCSVCGEDMGNQARLKAYRAGTFKKTLLDAKEREMRRPAPQLFLRRNTDS